MIDDEGVLFNPFSVGPANNNNRYTYEMPSSPTYPPPVFATWPPPKDHTNKSVSQGTLANERSATGAVVFKTSNSQMGQMAISRAINEDMAAAKQHADDKERIGAGAVSKTAISRAGSKESLEVKTLMSARPSCSASKSSMSQLSTVSARSNRSQLSTAKSLAGQSAHKVPSKMTTESSTTLKSVSQLKRSQKSSNLNKKEADIISQVSRRTKAGENLADNISRVSLKSHVNVHEADKISRVSPKSQASENQADKISRVSQVSLRTKAGENLADNISRVTLKSHVNVHEADKISLKSQASEYQADKISRVSQQSLANDYQADKISRHSIRSKADDQHKDIFSRASVHSKISRVGEIEDIASLKSKADMMKPLHSIGNSELPLNQRAALVKKELSQSMETSKSLSLKAAELSERLRAGNENKHNRHHSVLRMCSNNEPLKRCREDRMSLWFKDAVLS